MNYIILYYEKKNYARNPDDNELSVALKGLTLVLAERIENQDFIFEFMRK